MIWCWRLSTFFNWQDLICYLESCIFKENFHNLREISIVSFGSNFCTHPFDPCYGLTLTEVSCLFYVCTTYLEMRAGDWHHPVRLHQDMHDLLRPLVLSQNWKHQFLVHIKLLYLVEFFPSLLCVGFLYLFAIVLCYSILYFISE